MAMDAYQVWLKAVREKLAAAASEAEPLVAEGRFDDAEQMVRRVNDDIYGAVALGKMYTAALERCVRAASPDRAMAEVLYERAFRWRRAWPGVHTAEEAAAEAANTEEVRAELQALLAMAVQ